MPRANSEKNAYFGKTEPSAVISETEKEDYVETQSPEHTKVKNNSDTDCSERGDAFCRFICDVLDLIHRNIVLRAALHHLL